MSHLSDSSAPPDTPKATLSSKRSERIRDALTKALKPTQLEVIDQSDQHIGHAGWNEAGETHFHLIIDSPKFASLNRVARQRLVNDILQSEFDTGLHAASMQLLYNP